MTTPVLELPNQNVTDAYPRSVYPAFTLPTADPALAADDIAWALATLAHRRVEYQLYRDYMRGKHRLVFATDDYRQVFRAMLEGLRCNLCPSVCHALTDRLTVTGFAPHASDTTASPEAAAAWTLWQDRNMASIANRTHTEAVSSGDAYLLIWPDDDGDAQVYLHSPLEMAHRHDTERPQIVNLAAKMWIEGTYTRLTLYYADRLEKYRAETPKGGGSLKPASFVAYDPDGNGSTIDNPYGQVPVFHFGFDADAHNHGCSEIADVIPLQDALNKTLCDLMVAEEFGAYAQRYLLGVEPDVDDEGNPKAPPVQAGIDRLLMIANPDAKAGQFTPTDLTAYVGVIDAYCNLIARVKGIPLHYFFMVGTFPSGESQRVAEGRLVKRAEDTQIDFGIVWAAALRFALRVTGVSDDAHLQTTWANAQARSETDDTNVAATKVQKLSVSVQQAQRELGYSAEQIADMAAERMAVQPDVVPVPVPGQAGG